MASVKNAGQWAAAMKFEKPRTLRFVSNQEMIARSFLLASESCYNFPLSSSFHMTPPTPSILFPQFLFPSHTMTHTLFFLSHNVVITPQ